MCGMDLALKSKKQTIHMESNVSNIQTDTNIKIEIYFHFVYKLFNKIFADFSCQVFFYSPEKDWHY